MASRNEAAKRGMCLKAAAEITGPITNFSQDVMSILNMYITLHDFITSLESESDTNETGMQIGAAFHMALANNSERPLNMDKFKQDTKHFYSLVRMVQGKDVETLKGEVQWKEN